MDEHQVAVFMEERKWEYRSRSLFRIAVSPLIYFSAGFGFTAALLESVPIFGLVFTISNRIGAAMWAHGRIFLYSHLWILIFLL